MAFPLQARLEAAARTAPGGLCGGRLVCVDGLAGSGKTTLAAVLGLRWRAPVVHMDDLYDGWEGWDAGVRQLLDGVLVPLSRGEPGRYTRYDWQRATYAERHVVAPSPLLIVEGCGSGCREVAAYGALVVWVAIPDSQRLARGIARDGEAMRDHWRRWMAQERERHASEKTRERAEICVDGTDEVECLVRSMKEDE